MSVAVAAAIAGATPKTGFSPADIDGLALWLDASDESTITHSSGAVSQWDDKSGNDRHATQGTAAVQPTTGATTLNGLNVLDFDEDRMSGALSLSQPFTVLYVAKSAGTGYRVLTNGALSLQVLVNRNITSDPAVNLYAGNAFVEDGDPQAAGTWIIGSVVANGANSHALYDAPATTGNAGTGSFATTDEFYVGSRGSALELIGSIAEILVYGAALSAANEEAALAYLSAKWGVTPA